MNKATKLVLKGISNIIVISVVILLILLGGLKLFGFEIYTVLSGSMEPTYKVGSVIYVKEVNADELKKDDTITFKLTEETIATHRIVNVVEENNERKFETKGDANENNDEGYVTEDRILGKAIFTIPYLGYLAEFIQTKHGLMITLGVGVGLTVLVMLLDELTKDEKNKKKEQLKEEKEEKDE